MTDSGFKKSGLIYVKQPAKMRGRKIKSWKKLWVVIHTMSNRAAGTCVTQIDIYPSDEAAKNKIGCKQSIVMENLTTIQPVKSKTHKFAVEVVEKEPVLLLAGETELESQEWVEAIIHIFQSRSSNPFILGKDVHRATVIESKHTSRLGLGGEYEVHVSPEYMSIHSLDSYNSYEWSLKTLKRFQLLVENNILVFECGPASESGEATFQLVSTAAQHILAAIRKNIFIAVSLKKSTQKPVLSEEIDLQDKSRSNSVANSEKVLRSLLENCNQSRKEPVKPLKPENNEVASASRLPVNSSIKSIPSDLFISFDLPSISTRLSSVETLKSTDSRGIISSISSETSMSRTISELPNRPETSDMTPPFNEYNTLYEFASKRVSTLTNFSVIPVTIDNQSLQFVVDEHGYSHVNIQTNVTPTTDDKGRTLSNLSTASLISFRTNSTSSRDSGILVTATNSPIINAQTVQSEQKRNHRPTDSFDSAISTSSIKEDLTQTFKLSIEEIEICSADEADDNGKDYGYSVLYHHKNNHTRITDNTNTAAQHRKPSLHRSSSTGNVVPEENIYEDVDKYRKNLEKFLGLDPKIDPSAIPPSLPERPPTLKPKRKLMNLSANSRSMERKLFTLPKLSMSKGKKKDSTSSESDEESSEFRKGPSKVAVWPLGVMSVTDDNELYQGVANVNEATESRPRSNSLNVSVFSTREHKSQEQRKKGCVDLLTGDNLPEFLSSPVETKILCPGKFGPNSNSTPYDAKTGIHIDWDRKRTSHHTNGQDISLFDDLLSSSEENLRNSLNFSEEPIYAELKPCASDDITSEPPFPDIANWYPHHSCMDSEIKEPELVNKADLAVLDLFHFGFNFSVSGETCTRNQQNESSLSSGSIRSQACVFSETNSQNTGVSNANLSTLCVQDCISKITTRTDLTDSVYADMSFCSCDDIYVLPSDVVQTNK
ncbi:hypothetical protein ACJMK2_010422 [Sinanodonta woodiana]|uniref:PH domain-containing protein n=1 Tax=Sinanodonta woodiana TaxID=1069815 RepID=A0ABD3VFM7_SINWO